MQRNYQAAYSIECDWEAGVLWLEDMPVCHYPRPFELIDLELSVHEWPDVGGTHLHIQPESGCGVTSLGCLIAVPMSVVIEIFEMNRERIYEAIGS